MREPSAQEQVLSDFITALNEVFLRIRDLGFTEVSRTSTNTNDEPCQVIKFHNKAANRCLEISGFPTPICFVIITPIPALHKNRDYIEIGNYLAKYNLTELKALATRSTASHGTMPALEYFREYFSIAIRYLETDLRDIVEGKRWEDVPFDWSIADR